MVGNSTKYSVYTEFLVKDEKFNSGIRRMNKASENLKNSIHQVKSSIKNIELNKQLVANPLSPSLSLKRFAQAQLVEKEKKALKEREAAEKRVIKNRIAEEKKAQKIIAAAERGKLRKREVEEKKALKRRVAREKAAIKDLNRMGHGAGRTMMYAGGAAATLGAYYGLDIAKKRLIGYNAEIENYKIGIAGATSVMAEFAGANSAAENYMMWMDRTPGIVKNLREDAAALVGTSKEFVTSYNLFSGPIAQTGLAKTDKQLIKMTRDFNRLAVTSSAAMMNGEIGLGTSQLQRMLYGGAGAEMRMAQMMRIVGDEAERFNKLSPADRYRYLHEQLVKFQPAVKSYGNSWEGVTSTLEDTVDIVGGKIGEPLFGQVKTWISETNGWLTKHEDKISALAEVYGVKLRNAIDGFLGFDIQDAKWDDLEKRIDSVSEKLSTMATAGKWAFYGLGAAGLVKFIKGAGGMALGAWGVGEGVAMVGGGVVPGIAGVTAFGGGLATALAVGQNAALEQNYLTHNISAQQKLNGKYKPKSSFEEAKILAANQRALKEAYNKENIKNYYLTSSLGSHPTTYKQFEDNLKDMVEQAVYVHGGKDKTKRTEYFQEISSHLGLHEDLAKEYEKALVEWGAINKSGKLKGKGKGKNKTVKNRKPPKVKILQNFNGPITFDFKLEDIEPDRVAISVEKKFRQSLAQRGVGTLFKMGGSL